MVRMAVCLLLPLACVTGTPVAAQAISQEDRTAIGDRVAAFDTMMKQGRIGDSLDFVPPHLLDTIAKKVGVSPAQIKSSMAAQAGKALKDVKFVSFGMDTSAGTVGITPDKRRSYMLIPTETVIEIPASGRFRSKTNTLALKDHDVWYLVRIDGIQQVLTLREAYPEFAGVEFPNGSTTPVE